MISRRLFCMVLAGVAGVLALVVCSFGSAVAVAAEAAPAWEITQATAPTNLVPGSEASGTAKEPVKDEVPRWELFLTNVGDAVAGSVTITDTLPAGVTVASTTQPEVDMPNGTTDIDEPCAVSGQTVTCTVTRPTSPGELVKVYIPLAVAPAAGGEVVNGVSVSGGGMPPASSSAAATVGSALPSFGFAPATGLRTAAFDDAGLAPSQAGSHPFMVEVASEFNSGKGGLESPQGLRNLKFDLPDGLVVDPTAVPVRCTPAQLATVEEAVNPKAGCPVASQVGVVYVDIPDLGRGPDPLYVMVAPSGHPAELAFSYDGVIAHVLGGLGGDFHLTAESRELLTHFPIMGVDTYLWGVPSDPGHDPLRYGQDCHSHLGCSMEEVSPAPFLTMPSSCTEPLQLQGTATSWLGSEDTEKRSLVDVDGEPIHPTSCGSLAFEPTVESKATTEIGEHPSGLDFSIHQPQEASLEGRATATLKNAKVTLPEGMTLNPAAANGLSSCTEQQMGYEPEEGKIRFDTTSQGCPDAAKIGTVEASTPLLEETVHGSVYVAELFDNPFGSLLAIYLAIESKKSGIVAKLAGRVQPDPVTGRLTAIFTENPELPIKDIHVDLFGGENATLTTPVSCGEHQTSADLTPWSSPEGADAVLSASFGISSSCSSTEAAAPQSVVFSAGAIAPVAGAFSPFVLGLSRPDGSQHLGALNVTLPEGLLGKVAGVPYCSDAQIVQAQARSHPEEGKLEQQSPSCPATSEVGTVTVGAGSGPEPTYVTGHAYLAGPYKGAPLSLAIITPAIAGPFDLGTVVVRVALNIDPNTAQIHALSDPIPTILDGIPLDVRSISLNTNRPGFTFNPTSCEPTTVTGQATSTLNQTTSLSDRFQVGGCQGLPFKPLMSISTQGKTSKANGASLNVKVSQQPGEAHIHKVDLTLPTVLPARLSTLQQACTEAQFNTNPANCPPGSFIGTATANTPILSVPLTGPAILVSHGGAAFPDVEFLLQANERGADIQVDLDGKTDIKKGVTYSRFETVPDAPITTFETTLPQGPHSVLSANGNLCTSKPTIPTEMTGQNGALLQQTTKVTVTGCPKAKTLTRAQKLKLALKACHKKPKGKKRTSCERAARKQYGPLKKKKSKRK